MINIRGYFATQLSHPHQVSSSMSYRVYCRASPMSLYIWTISWLLERLMKSTYRFPIRYWSDWRQRGWRTCSLGWRASVRQWCEFPIIRACDCYTRGCYTPATPPGSAWASRYPEESSSSRNVLNWIQDCVFVDCIVSALCIAALCIGACILRVTFLFISMWYMCKLFAIHLSVLFVL